jgi:hypothetical protein
MQPLVESCISRKTGSRGVHLPGNCHEGMQGGTHYHLIRSRQKQPQVLHHRECHLKKVRQVATNLGELKIWGLTYTKGSCTSKEKDLLKLLA